MCSSFSLSGDITGTMTDDTEDVAIVTAAGLPALSSLCIFSIASLLADSRLSFPFLAPTSSLAVSRENILLGAFAAEVCGGSFDVME